MANRRCPFCDGILRADIVQIDTCPVCGKTEIDADAAEIEALKAENAALRQQLAALQTPAQAGKLLIEWHAPTTADALDAMLDEMFGEGDVGK